MKATRVFQQIIKVLICAGVAGIFVQGAWLHALPEGMSVQAGQVSATTSGNTMSIQSSSAQSIVNWNSFSIMQNEITKIQLPDAQAAILNRVTGASISQLLGTLQSNGQVILLNPNGIMVGNGAVIDVASLTLSTLNLPDQAFLNGGALAFTGDSQASVVNMGTIKTFNGDVNILAVHVENTGDIEASGNINMVAGDSILLQPAGQNSFAVLVEGKDVTEATADAQARGSYAQAINSGSLHAGVLGVNSDRSGRVTLSAVNPKRSRVINDGTITGDHISVVSNQGEAQVSGTIAASGSTGKVEILGDNVALTNANVSAKRGNDGGDVRIGGDWHGGGTLQRSTMTTIDKDSKISVNGSQNGNGGQAVVWSDGTTDFDGRITAKGGELSGNGGKMEVSGKQILHFNGTADAFAPNGEVGSLLLDPKNIIISSSGAGVLTGVDEFTDTPAADVTISTTTLKAALDTGTAVTLQANTDITLDTDLTVANGGGDGGAITMQAGRSILLNANITTDNGALTMVANETAANGVDVGNRDAGDGSVTARIGTTINAGTGTLIVTIQDTSNVGTIRLGTVTAGAVTITTQDGDFTQLYPMTLGGLLTVDAGTGTVNLASSSNAFNAAGMTLTAADAYVNAAGAVQVTGGAMGALFLNTTGAVTTGGAPAVTGVAVFYGSGVTISGGTYGSMGFYTAGNVGVSGVTTVNLGASDITGNTTVSGATTIADSGNVRSLGDFSLSASGSINMDSSNNWIGDAQADTVTLAISDNDGDIYFRNASVGDSSGPNGGSAQFAGINLTGGANKLELIVGGNVTQTGAFTVGGLIRINAAAQDVDLTNVGNSAGTWRLYGSDVAVTSAGAMQLGKSYITGDATLTALAAGDITDLDGAGADAGKIVIIGDTTLVASGDDIILNRADGEYGTLILTADNATITNNKATDFGASTIGTNLTVTSAGGVSDSGNMSVGGLFTLSAAGQGIVLDQAGHAFGSINITGASLDFTESNATAIAGLSITGAGEINSGGAITQTGTATIGGLTTLNAGANNITLGDTSNTFGTLILTGGAITIYENAATDLGATSATSLTVTATGAITDSDTVAVTGAAVFKTLADAGAAITLNTAANNFGSVDARARNLADGADADGNITITETGDTAIAAIRTAGDLSVSSTGVITQTGTIVVGGDAAFATTKAAVGDVVLGASSNINFGAGSSTVGGDFTLDFATSGTYTVTQDGPSPAGDLRVAGTFDASEALSVTLNNTGNILNDKITPGGVQTITGVGDVVLGNINIAGDLVVNAVLSQDGFASEYDGNAIILSNTGNTFGGSVTVNTAYDTIDTNTADHASISQAALTTLTIGGSSTFTAATGGAAPNGSITVDHDNSFTGWVALSGAATSLKDVAGSTQINSLTATSFTINSAGDITQGASALTTTGTTTITANAGTGSVTLTHASNAFGNLIVTADAVNIRENADITQGGAWTTGATTLNAGANAVTLTNAGNVMGALTVTGGTTQITENDAITQGSAWTTGATTLNAGANAITLLDTSNTFGQLVLTGGATQIYENADTDLGATSVASLSVTSTGTITDSGNQTVTGAAVFKTLNDAGKVITLNNTNAFGSVSASTRNAADGANVDADIIIVENDATDIALINTLGDLSITSGGAIIGSGALTVGGTSSFTSSLDAAAITLNTAANALTGAVTFAPTGAGNVTLVNNRATVLAASTIGGTFDLTSNGAVTQSGALAIAGTTTLNAGANDITLGTTTNTFGTLVLTGGTITIYENAATDLGATSATALTVTSTNSITDSNTVAVTGAAVFKTLNDAGGVITLNTAANNFGSIDARARNAADGANADGNITITETGDTALAAIRTAGDLTVSSTGVITQTGTINLTGVGTVASFTTTKALVGDVVLGASSNINFGTGSSTIGGDLTLDFVTSGTYAVTQTADTGDLKVAGVFDASEAASVTLPNAGNSLLNRIDPGGTQTITEVGDVVLGDINIAGDLVVSAVLSQDEFDSVYSGNAIILSNTGNTFAGSVQLNTDHDTVSTVSSDHASISQQVGTTLTIGGNSTFLAATGGAAPNGDITLGYANSFAGTVSLSGADTIFVDTNGGTQINTLNVTTFQLTSAGNITQAGSGLTTTGTTTLAANGGAGNITWDNASNSFGTLVMNGATISVRENAAMDLGATTATALTAVAAGAITDSGNVAVTGAAVFKTLDDNGSDITLNSAGNSFGSVDARVRNAADGANADGTITITETNATDLATIATTGNLVVSSGGAITDSGALTVGGTSSFTSSLDAAAITLDFATNSLTGAVTFAPTGAGNVTLVNNRATLLGGSTIGGTFDLTSNGDVTQSGALAITGTTTVGAGANAITLTTATNTFGQLNLTGGVTQIFENADTDLGTTSVASLAVVSTGTITDSGNQSVTGAAVFETCNDAGKVITLNNTNAFGSISASTRNTADDANVNADVTIVENDATDIALIDTLGNLSVTSGGAIVDSGAMTVGGTSHFASSLDAAGITLDTATNALTGAVTFAPTGAGNVLLVNNRATLLGASTIGGTFNLDSNGDVTQSGALAITGLTTVDAGANAITLTTTTNTFGTLALTGGVVQIYENAAMNFGASSISNTLTATSTGAITDSGALSVTNAAAFKTLNDTGAAITLNDTVNVGSFSAQTRNAADGANVDADITLVEASATDIVLVNTLGDLSVTSGGAITDSGAMTVGGTSYFASSLDGADITLNTAGNSLTGAVTFAPTGSGSVLLVNNRATDLGASTIGGTFNLTSNGAVTQSGALAVTDTTTVNAGANNITLGTTTNTFGTLALTGGTITIYENAATDLGATSASALTVTSTNSITDSNTVAVTGAAVFKTLNDAGGAITLNTAANNFGSIDARARNAADGANADGNITITETGDTALAAIQTAGDLTVSSTGVITQTGALAIGGDASFTTTKALVGDVVLGANSNINFGTGVSTIGGDLTLDFATSGTYNVTQTADTGDLRVAGTFDASEAASVVLPNAGNSLANRLNPGGTQSVTEVGDVVLGDINIAGDLTVTAVLSQDEFASSYNGNAIILNNTANTFGGSVMLNTEHDTISTNTADHASISQQVGTTITVGGTATFVAATGGAAPNGDITLGYANSFAGVVSLSGADIVLVDTNGGTQLSGLTATTFQMTSAGAITQSAALTTIGATSFKTLSDAGAGITLNTAGNNFGTLTLRSRNAADTADSSGNISVTEAGSMGVTTAVTNGSVALTSSGGSIDTGGGTVVGSAVTMTANSGATGITLGGIQANSGNVTLTAGTSGISEGVGASIITPGMLDITSGGDVAMGTGVYSLPQIKLTSVTGNATMRNIGNTVFRTSSVTGDLTTTVVGGNITAQGVETLTVGGTASFTALGRAVNLNGANHAITALALDADDADVHVAGGLALAASTLTDDLSLTAGGNVTDTGDLIVGGDLNVSAATHNITLDALGNQFGSVSLTAASATLNEDDTMNLWDVTTTGNFTAYTVGGNIVDTTGHTVSVGGTAILVPGGNATNVDDPTGHEGEFAYGEAGKGGIHDVILNDGDFTATSIRIYAYNAIVDADGSINFANSNIANNLTVAAVGDITDSSIILVGNDATFLGNNITLDGEWTVVGSINFTGQNVLFNSMDDLTLNGSAVANSMSLIAAGSIDQIGAFSAGSFTANATGAVDISAAANSIGAFSNISAGGDILARTSGDLNLSGNLVGDKITMVGAGAFTNTGDIFAAGGYHVYAGSENDRGSLSGFLRDSQVYPDGWGLAGSWLHIAGYINPYSGDSGSTADTSYNWGNIVNSNDYYWGLYGEDSSRSDSSYVYANSDDLGFRVITFDGGRSFVYLYGPEVVYHGERVGIIEAQSEDGTIVLAGSAEQIRRHRITEPYLFTFKPVRVSSYSVPVKSNKEEDEKDEENEADDVKLTLPELPSPQEIIKEEKLKLWR